MDFIPLPDNASRQVIDSTTVFDEYRRVQAEAGKYAGGMYWKRQSDYEYLVKTMRDNRQHRVGPRSPETEGIYTEFTTRKQRAESRLQSLRAALGEAERMNKALKAGRTPALVITLLQTIEDAGLGMHFTVVGTHALYAYETAAGVHIAPGALATQDVDLLWDARKRVQFLTDLKRVDASMLRVLQWADPSFRRKDKQNETAINAKGFEVAFFLAYGSTGRCAPLPLLRRRGRLVAGAGHPRLGADRSPSLRAPMATSNSPTFGQSNSSRQDGGIINRLMCRGPCGLRPP